MPKFQYKAKNMQGKLIEGLYDAPNQTAVIEMIRQKNYFHLEVKEIIERKDLSESGFRKRIGKRDIAIFCRQFASILKAGVPLVQCIVMLSEQTSNKVLKSVLISVNEDIQKGSTLSQALMRHEEKFPPLLLNMIEAGEVSGTIDDTLELMAGHFEKDYKLQQKVKGAMVYPVAVMIVAVVVIVFMLIA
ncbi:MAG TPA: type II secretion system F family protein, partial [Epulopiscium sp.]|nr:type II secretion system F family protein [Candidatus Epulonipiscium sp.]